MNEQVDALAKALESWPQATMDEIHGAATLVRSAADAQVVLRLGYSNLFEAVPEEDWRVWDELSAAINQCWVLPTNLPRLINSANEVGLRVMKIATSFDRSSQQPRPATIGRFAMGMLMMGVLFSALGRRLKELLDEARRLADQKRATEAAA